MSSQEMNWQLLIEKAQQHPHQKMIYEILAMVAEYEDEATIYELWRRANFLKHSAERGIPGVADEIEDDT